MTATALRPRTAVEIIDAAFQLMRWHYPQLAAVYALVLVPPFLMELFLPPTGSLLQLVLGPAGAAAVALLVSEAYLGRPAHVGFAMQRVFARFWSVFGAAILQGIIMVSVPMVGVILIAIMIPLGLVPLAVIVGLALVPIWIVVVVWAFAMQQAVIIEGRGALQSFDRSRELAKGAVMRILGVFILAFGIAIAVGVGAAALVMFLGMLVGATGDRTAALATTVGMVLAYPVWGVVSTLVYYDLRIRKEAFDLQLLASQLEVAPAVGAR